MLLNISFNVSVTRRRLHNYDFVSWSYSKPQTRAYSISLSFRALKLKHIQGINTMLLAAKTRFIYHMQKVPGVSKFQLNHRISMSEKVEKMNKIWLKNSTTKSRKVTESRMIISRKSASKNWTSDLFHYLDWREEKLTIATE